MRASSGIGAAAVPPEFPLVVADHLRAGGIELDVDARGVRHAAGGARPTPQLDGIRRAQKAADAAMGVAGDADPRAAARADLRGGARRDGGGRDEHGCELPGDVIVSHGAQSAIGHESGYGAMAAGEPVVVDIWPRDRASRCWADMTRTFVAGGGEPAAELAEYWRLTRDSLDRVYADGPRRAPTARTLFRAAPASPTSRPGKPTQLTKAAGRGPARTATSTGSATASGWRSTSARASGRLGGRR